MGIVKNNKSSFYKKRKPLSGSLPSNVKLETRINEKSYTAYCYIKDAKTNRILETYTFDSRTYQNYDYRREASRLYLAMLAKKKTKFNPLRKPLEEFTIRELKKLASIYRIEGYGNLTKGQLCKRVKWHLENR